MFSYIKKHTLLCINLMLTVAMVIYIAIAWYRHEIAIMNSAPAWVTIFYSIYFLVPMGIINLGYLIIQRIRRTK